MTDEEKEVLNEQDNNAQSNNNKQDNDNKKRRVIVSSICAILLLVIILLLILFGLKNCKGCASDIPNISSQKHDYNEEKLDDKFKAIVNAYRVGPGSSEPDNIVEVEAVSYIDNYSSGTYSLSITVLSESNKVYEYKAVDAYYPEDKSRYDNLISYLLLDDTPDELSLGDINTSYSCNEYKKIEETISTDKVCKYIITSNNSNTKKYIDGFYYLNNEYHIYQHQEYSGTDPFINKATQVVGPNDPLYGYYQYLNK